MSANESLLVQLLTEHRGLIIVVIGLPLGFVFTYLVRLQRWLLRATNKVASHEERVRRVQRQIRQWNKLPQSSRGRLCTARPNWSNLSTRFFDKKNCSKIQLDFLHNLLTVDTERRVVKVEPMVTVGDITRELIPRGWTLAVTLEIEDATLGGLAMGVGMTTHSHKAGLYQETIKSYDVVTADGTLIHVTADNEHQDLFYCLPWSHGTLGFLVALELQIIPVKSHVHLTYTPFNSQKDYCSYIREVSLDPNGPDFVEATIFSEHKAVVMSGRFADVTTPQQKAKVNPVARWYKPWFFKHVESFLDSGENDEFIPLRDYLLRHNRAIFWTVQDMIPFGNNPLFRLFLGWMCPPRVTFLKFSTTPKFRELTFTKQVFQDITLPMSALEKSISLSKETFEIWPILIYPCRVMDHKRGESGQGQVRAPRDTDMVPGTNYGMFFDLGVYGVPEKVKQKQYYNPVEAMRTMEAFTRDVGGYSFLYADTFMNEEEFRVMFDHTLYEKARKKYGAEDAFPTLYEKTKPEIDVIAIGLESCSATV